LGPDHDRESRSSHSAIAIALSPAVRLVYWKGNFRCATLEMRDRRPAIERLTDNQAWRRVTAAKYTANLRHRGSTERFDLAALEARGQKGSRFIHAHKAARLYCDPRNCRVVLFRSLFYHFVLGRVLLARHERLSLRAPKRMIRVTRMLVLPSLIYWSLEARGLPVIPVISL